MRRRERADVRRRLETMLLGAVFVGLPWLAYSQQDKAVRCEQGFFGANCTGVCHCLNGPSECDSEDGVCNDYICDRGWNDSPYCQTPCHEGLFGINCEDECHCPEGDTCNKVNGLCDSGSCHPDWSGPGCQIRLPKLTTPPDVIDVTCYSFVLVWQTWNEDTDIGVKPVGSYTIQRSTNESSWVDVRQVPEQGGASNISVRFHSVDPYTTYEFRIRANRLDYGKTVWGIPGPRSSPPTKTIDECYVPTTAPSTTTTISTTTTVTTTTTVPTTTTTTPTTQPPTTPTTAPPIPGPVTNISITIDVDGNALVTWLPPNTSSSVITGYNITYQAIGIGDCDNDYRSAARTISVVPSSRRVNIQDLVAWRRYNISLLAYNSKGIGQLVEKTFLSKETAPTGQISNIRVISLTSVSVNLTWNKVPCIERGGFFQSYEVFVKDDLATIQILTSNTEEVYVNGLAPYTNYTIEVRYVNSVGSGPYSEAVHIETLQGLPSAPRNLRVARTTNTSLLLSWGPPMYSNGVLVQYRIIYWRTGVEGTETILTLDAASGTQASIGGLKPYTSYNIKIQARTGASLNGGWGARSSVITQTTEEGRPGPPTGLRRTYRNESCLGLAWSRPSEQNGIIIKYKISYGVVAVRYISAIKPDQIVEEIPGGVLKYVPCSLMPAAQYRFQVQASTSATFGDPATLDIWTEVGIPDIPPIPVVRKTTDSNITIRIQPVLLTKGPVSGYFIVLEKIDENPDTVFQRRKRQIDLPNPVERIPLPGATVAYLEKGEVRVARNFVVGDGQMYGKYFNSRLTKGALYNIYYVVATSLDGITKMSFSQIQIPVRAVLVTTTTTTTTPPQTTTTKTATITLPFNNTPKTTEETLGSTEAVTKRNDNTSLIVAIVIPIIILLIFLACLLIYFLVFRKRQRKENLKSSWLNYYTKHYYDAAKKMPKGVWSDIYDLSQPRHVTVNEQTSYMPDDLKVAEIHHNRPKISFEEEYRHLPEGKKFAWLTGERPENSEKNRFERLLPYDHSLVKLRPPSPSSYINANYVYGYEAHTNIRNTYIAAQSPFNDRTIADFWFMVHQERCTQIVFLANLEEDGIIKSEQYWPEKGQEVEYDHVAVRTLQTDYFANFVVRTFDIYLTGSDAGQRVHQYHFTSWPDHGVPQDPIPFLEFRMKVRTSEEFGRGGPMVVHCGTGVSRAAVFIAVDSLLEQAKLENRVNVFKFCNKMRNARTMMVRTLKQYKFIYDTLLEALLTNYNIVGDDLKVNYRLLSKINPITDKSLFREQFEILERFTPALTEAQCRDALSAQNLVKNRFRTIVPPDEHRPVLSTPGGLHRTDYVNAVYVDSYTLKEAFIVTQTPLTSTVIDFWKLVYDRGVNCVVMLNGSDFKEDTCAEYLPPAANMQQKYEPFFVRLDDVVRTEHVTVRTVRLSNALSPSERPRVIKQFQFESWRMYEKTPWSRDGFIVVIEAVNDWLEESGAGDIPVLVHCMDGASQSGLFCACSVICEKMMLEGQVDVFHTIKHMKRRRKHFVNSLEQYKFCFKLLWDYMNCRLQGNTLANGQINLAFEEQLI